MTQQNTLKHTFDEVASLYNEARPRYPDELFSILIAITGLHRDSKLLEIGPGTGQATKPLADKGFDITAIELGATLTEVAKHELQPYKNIRLVTAPFEEIALPAASFDLVYAATSFHWIEPSIKYLKTHNLLKEKGHLAIIHTNHISDEKGDAFFNASQPVFDRYGFTDKHQKPKLSRNEDLKPDDIDERLFRLIHFQCFPITIIYSAKNFVKLLNTFSNHLAASKEVQDGFYKEIENLINNEFEGKIEKHFSMSLTVAEKI
jgi:ubiquinone/menaquinone biosynthesis C-methylase UbiE